MLNARDRDFPSFYVYFANMLLSIIYVNMIYDI